MWKAQLGVIWTVAVWCSYLFQNIRNAMRSQHFGMKGREIRLMLTRYAPWWQISDGFLLRVYFLYFLTVKLTEDWPRMWTVAFSISPGVDNNQLPTRFFVERSVNRFSTIISKKKNVSTALVPIVPDPPSPNYLPHTFS